MSYMAGLTPETEPSKIKAVRSPGRPRSTPKPRSALKPSAQQATSPIAQGDKNPESAEPSSQSSSSEDEVIYAASKAGAFNARKMWSNVFLVRLVYTDILAGIRNVQYHAKFHCIHSINMQLGHTRGEALTACGDAGCGNSLDRGCS